MAKRWKADADFFVAVCECGFEYLGTAAVRGLYPASALGFFFLKTSHPEVFALQIIESAG